MSPMSRRTLFYGSMIFSVIALGPLSLLSVVASSTPEQPYAVVAQADSQGEPKSATWSSGSSKLNAASGRNEGLSLRDARKMGISVVSVLREVRKLKNEGMITKDTTDAEVAVMVADELFENNKAAWGDPKAINWDVVLSFIETLLPIIIKLLGL